MKGNVKNSLQDNEPVEQADTSVDSQEHESSRDLMQTVRSVWDDPEQSIDLSAEDTILRTQTIPTVLLGDTPSSSSLVNCPLPSRVTEFIDQAPSELGDYHLAGVIGEGGMGTVYEAKQTNLDRAVALKRLKLASSHNKQAKRMFLAEAIASANLEHPNIVPIYDLAEDSAGLPFYTMKCINGHSWSKQFKLNSVEDNLRILMAVADAVAYAHAHGVAHNDIKPSNVMLGDFGEVLLLDWGMATAVEAHGKAVPLKETEETGGTPAYMPPETALGQVDKQGYHSDVYQLGALLFHILTGKAPLPG